MPEGGGFNSGPAHWLGPGRLGGHCLVSADAPSSREKVSFSRPLHSYLASVIAVGQSAVLILAFCVGSWTRVPVLSVFTLSVPLTQGFESDSPTLILVRVFVFEDICGCDRFVGKTVGELRAERATRKVLYLIQ